MGNFLVGGGDMVLVDFKPAANGVCDFGFGDLGRSLFTAWGSVGVSSFLFKIFGRPNRVIGAGVLGSSADVGFVTNTRRRIGVVAEIPVDSVAVDVVVVVAVDDVVVAVAVDIVVVGVAVGVDTFFVVVVVFVAIGVDVVVVLAIGDSVVVVVFAAILFVAVVGDVVAVVDGKVVDLEAIPLVVGICMFWDVSACIAPCNGIGVMVIPGGTVGSAFFGAGIGTGVAGVGDDT